MTSKTAEALQHTPTAAPGLAHFAFAYEALSGAGCIDNTAALGCRSGRMSGGPGFFAVFRLAHILLRVADDVRIGHRGLAAPSKGADDVGEECLVLSMPLTRLQLPHPFPFLCT
eukprot:TRINITY_DN44_c1_g1_i2.p5 TRINITY_DN44_c1_g1~~TRINITY_DN44_c1_g1_i2.p5  ORF type:complete len:114 (-),score=11.02 TRINITY_DN44_c1_g1_i2:265-606(-)